MRYSGRAVKQTLGLLGCVLSFYLPMMMSQTEPAMQCATTTSEVVAARTEREIKLDAAHPASDWQSATPVNFCADWQGKNADPARKTEVRILWSPQTLTLYLRFECKYRKLHVFEDSESDGRRDRLWERDVAEAFLQPDPSRMNSYAEFEISPNAMWLDLGIDSGARRNLNSGLRRSVVIDEHARTWAAELAIPMTSVVTKFDPQATWRANFYRVEGMQEPRRYMAWRPTHTAQPDFHVPSTFGTLRFANPKP